MQRLFSSFPDRLPGVALLMWRLCTGGMVVYEAWPSAPRALDTWWVAVAAACVVALAAGLMTPFAAAGVVALEVWDLSLASCPPQLLAMACAVSIVLIGPGAYSLDARLFARRVVTWRSRR